MTSKKYNLRADITKKGPTRNTKINSHYKVDYILTQFDQLQKEEIFDSVNDPLTNGYFKEFLDLVHKLRKNVDESRNSTVTDIARLYAVNVGDYRNYLNAISDTDSLGLVHSPEKTAKQLLEDKVDIFNKNYFDHVSQHTTVTEIKPDGSSVETLTPKLDFYFHDFTKNILPTDPIYANLPYGKLSILPNGTNLETDLDEIIAKWDEYQASLIPVKEERNPFEKMLTDLDTNAKNLLDGMESHDYEENYQTVEK